MRITQAVTKAGDVTFYDSVGMISNQATLVDSQAPKKETPRKINAAQKDGGRGRGSNGGHGSGRGGGQGHGHGHGHGGGRGRGSRGPNRAFIPLDKINLLVMKSHCFST
jgi:hypothetical protein